MSAIEPLSNLINIKFHHLKKDEMYLLEAELFTHVYNNLKDILRPQFTDYFKFITLTEEMENHMLDLYFGRFIVNDILSSEEYTLDGIAHYANIDREVVESIFLSNNSNPSAILIRKLIELHRGVRKNLYKSIMEKIGVANIQV